MFSLLYKASTLVVPSHLSHTRTRGLKVECHGAKWLLVVIVIVDYLPLHATIDGRIGGNMVDILTQVNKFNEVCGPPPFMEGGDGASTAEVRSLSHV